MKIEYSKEADAIYVYLNIALHRQVNMLPKLYNADFSYVSCARLEFTLGELAVRSNLSSFKPSKEPL